jgi:hypothetical protein
MQLNIKFLARILFLSHYQLALYQTHSRIQMSYNVKKIVVIKLANISF